MSTEIKKKTFITDNLQHFKKCILPFQKHCALKPLCWNVMLVKPHVRFLSNLLYGKQIQNSHETMPLCIFKEAMIVNWKKWEGKDNEKWLLIKKPSTIKILSKFHFNRSQQVHFLKRLSNQFYMFTCNENVLLHMIKLLCMPYNQ